MRVPTKKVSGFKILNFIVRILHVDIVGNLDVFQHIHRYKKATLVWHYVIHISGLWCSITSYINSNTTMSLETVQMRVQIWGLHAAQRWTTSVPTAWGNKLFRNMHILSKGVFLQRATARHLPSIPFTSGAVMKSSINPSVLISLAISGAQQMLRLLRWPQSWDCWGQDTAPAAILLCTSKEDAWKFSLTSSPSQDVLCISVPRREL